MTADLDITEGKGLGLPGLSGSLDVCWAAFCNSDEGPLRDLLASLESEDLGAVLAGLTETQADRLWVMVVSLEGRPAVGDRLMNLLKDVSENDQK